MAGLCSHRRDVHSFVCFIVMFFVCFLSASSWLPAAALFEDQVGLYDWHQQHVGRVHLAVFSTGGQRKRVFVATESNVVAGLHLRSGALAWRQVLAPSDPIHAMELPGKYLVTLSGNGRVRAWSLVDGTLAWDTPLPSQQEDESACTEHGHVADEDKERPAVDVLVLPPADVKASSADIIVLFSGGLHRLSSLSGDIKWSKPTRAKRIFSLPHSADSILAVGISLSTLHQSEIATSSGDALRSSSHPAPSSPISPSLLLVSSNHILVASSSGTSVLACQLAAPHSSDLTPVALPPSLAGQTFQILPEKVEAGFWAQAGDKVFLVRAEADETKGIRLVVPPHGRLEKGDANFEAEVAVSSELALGEGGGQVVGVARVRGRGEGDGNQTVELQLLSSSPRPSLPPLLSSFQIESHRGSVSRLFLNAYPRQQGRPASADKPSPSVLKETTDSDWPFGFRGLVVMEDDSLALLQQGAVVWLRNESLASVAAAAMLDPPVEEGEEVSVKAVEHNIEEWLKAHWQRTKVTMMIASPAEEAEVQNLRLHSPEKTKPTRDRNGFRKFIIVATQSGKISALHSGDGRILWSTFPAALRGKAVGKKKILKIILLTSALEEAEGISPQVAIIARIESKGATSAQAGAGNGQDIVVVLDGHSGKELFAEFLPFSVSLVLQPPVDSGSGKKVVLFVEASSGGQEASPRAFLLAPSAEEKDGVAAQRSRYPFYVVNKEEGVVAGFVLGAEEAAAKQFLGRLLFSFKMEQIWQVVFPKASEQIVAVATPSADEVAHTQSAVQPNRDVAFRFISPNLAFIATVSSSSEESSLFASVVDTVIGRVLLRVHHANARGPVQAVFCENWVVYHFFNIAAQRYEMSVVELYEGDAQASLSAEVLAAAVGFSGPTNLTAPLSSWSHGLQNVSSRQQSYFFPLSLRTVAVTKTRGGITQRFLLLGTAANRVLAMDKRLLDPRRSREPSKEEKEGGIMPYQDILPISSKAYVTHAVQVEGLSSIITEPSRLESTTLVFAHGIDLFFVRLAPSRMFDSLSDDFSYFLLLATIVGLCIAIVVTSLLAKRAELNARWS